MPFAFEHDNGNDITYESAVKKDENVIHEVTYPAARLFQELWDVRPTMQLCSASSRATRS